MMNYFKHICNINTWNIGFVEKSSVDIRAKTTRIGNVNWLKHPFTDRFFADPFILKVTPDCFEVLVEEFLYTEKNGTITKLVIDKNFRLCKRVVVHREPSHQSYPFVIRHNGTTFVIPESSMDKSTYIYNYDSIAEKLTHKTLLSDQPLLDPTLLFHHDTWYLFACMKGDDDRERLHLFFSNHLAGPYTPHPLNPLPYEPALSRPAGHFIKQGDKIFRVSQISRESYGQGILASEVAQLDRQQYREQKINEIHLHDDIYDKGFHTINCLEDICVIDGLKTMFQPLRRLSYEGKYRMNRLFA